MLNDIDHLMMYSMVYVYLSVSLGVEHSRKPCKKAKPIEIRRQTFGCGLEWVQRNRCIRWVPESPTGRGIFGRGRLQCTGCLTDHVMGTTVCDG